jgi:hypothetical protein
MLEANDSLEQRASEMGLFALVSEQGAWNQCTCPLR